MWPYVQELPKGSRLLDGGCGLGDWVVWFSRAGYPTVGLDVSRTTIGKLQEMFPDKAFKVGDIRETGLPDASIDTYFSWGTFEHFEEGFGRVVPEAYRVLKPGGRLFVSMPTVNLRHAVSDTLRSAKNIGPKTQRTRFYQWRMTRRELADTLARHGFSVESVHIFAKRNGLQRWISSVSGINADSNFARGAAFLAAPFVPRILIGHMMLAVAQKPRS
jgi:ubiquinone/menaquinone biosynthesis C-methylase UbiE